MARMGLTLHTVSNKIGGARGIPGGGFVRRQYEYGDMGGVERRSPQAEKVQTEPYALEIRPPNLKREVNKCIILHYSPFKAVWDWIVLLLVIYTAILTPYAAAFLIQSDQVQAVLNKDPKTRGGQGITNRYSSPLVTIDIIVDLLFILDIFINFRTTYVNKNQDIVTNPKRIAVNYLKSWFIVDVLAAIPFDLLLFGSQTDEQATTTMGLLKTARLLRLLRVTRKLESYSQYAPAVLILLMCTFTLISHWLACIWYAIGSTERATLEDPSIGWLGYLAEQIKEPYYKNDTNSGPGLDAKYLTALYFVLTTLTTVGFGNVSPNTDGEKLFAIIIMLLGSLMFAFIFGNVTAIIDRLYQKMARYQEEIGLVKEFIKFHHIPSPLKPRLIEYFEHAWNFTNGMDMTELMDDLPEFLQAEVCLHLNRNLLNSCPAFKMATQGCLKALSTKFRTTHAGPGDILLHQGDLLTDLYFISRGSVEVLKQDMVMVILCKGDIFGENLVKYINIGKSKATIRALTYCDLHKLGKEDLLNVIKIYPEFRQQFLSNLLITCDLRDIEQSQVSPFNSNNKEAVNKVFDIKKKSSSLMMAQFDNNGDIIGSPSKQNTLNSNKPKIHQFYSKHKKICQDKTDKKNNKKYYSLTTQTPQKYLLNNKFKTMATQINNFDSKLSNSIEEIYLAIRQSHEELVKYTSDSELQ